MTPTPDEVLDHVIRAVTTMCAEWQIEAGPVRRETRLSGDLNFSSIEAMHLLAVLNLRFGPRLPFDVLIRRGAWYATELTVGELAAFIHEQVHGGAVPRG